MAENEQDIVEGVIESVAEQMTENKAKTHALLWFAIIVLLALLVGLSWFSYQEEVKQQALILTLNQATANKNDALVNDITHLKQTSSKQIDVLTKSNAALASKMTEIVAMQQLTNDDIQQKWILSEVKFLLKVANQRILLAGDVENAQVALTLADQQLKILADPRLYQLRALIAGEQLALASVARVDIDGLATQLQSAIDGVDTLKILTSNEAMDSFDNMEAETVTETTFKTVAIDVWGAIMSAVDIRYEDVGSIITLAPEHQYFLYQNLRLKLESARLALLSDRAFIFKSNLFEIEGWLQQYFIGSERDAMLAIIKEMQLEKIKVELPDISTSLIWLQQKGEQE